MRIGVDIDGVLNDVGLFELEYGSKFYIEKTDKHLTNSNGDGSYAIFNGTIEEDNKFWSQAIYQFIKYPARDFAAEVLKKLKDKGHDIYIVTARTSDLSYCDITPIKMKKIVKRWLKKYHITYDKIIWTGKEKVTACLENQIDIMIDDSPRHIVALSKHIPVICYDTKYNQMCNGDNIIRCFSWYDILDKISQLRK